jgi:DNA-binding GntR family transcriptional regulator
MARSTRKPSQPPAMVNTGHITVPSLQQAVYARLKAAIRDGELQRDSQPNGIALKELAYALGVSTMPVREAVRRLEAEGLVAFGRSTGVRIQHLSAEDFSETADMRIRLESLAFEKAFDKITKGDLEELSRLIALMKRCQNGSEWLRLNREFHSLISSRSGYPRLLTVIENLWTATEPYLRNYIADMRNLHDADRDHEEMLASIQGRDLEGGLVTVEHHIRRVEHLLLHGDTVHFRDVDNGLKLRPGSPV